MFYTHSVSIRHDNGVESGRVPIRHDNGAGGTGSVFTITISYFRTLTRYPTHIQQG